MIAMRMANFPYLCIVPLKFNYTPVWAWTILRRLGSEFVPGKRCDSCVARCPESSSIFTDYPVSDEGSVINTRGTEPPDPGRADGGVTARELLDLPGTDRDRIRHATIDR